MNQRAVYVENKGFHVLVARWQWGSGKQKAVDWGFSHKSYQVFVPIVCELRHL